MQERCKIGVVIGNANSPHAVNIMKGIDQASKECDVQLMYFMNVSSPYTAQLYPPDKSIGWDYQKSAIYDYARYVKADVLIMTYGMMSIFMKSDYGKQYLEYFRNVPCVLINEQTDRPNWTSIIVDNYNGMYELVEHLVRDHGYHNFAFLAGPPGNTDACQRKRAFLDVMKKYDLPMDESRIETGDFSECVQKQVNALLDRIPNLQAIVCANDVMALTAYQECEKRGLHIGQDIAVTGFDDWERIRHMPVPITTIHQDSERSGYMAVYSALELARSGQGKNIVIPAKVCVRESCGCTCKQFSGFDQIENMGQKFVYEKQRNTVYRQKTWMVPMISRNMLIALQDREKFLKNALTPMSFFGVKTALLYVFRNPVEYNIEKGWEFPNTIYLVARQDGERVEVFEEYKNEVSLEKCGFSEEGSACYQHQPSVFCLQSGSTQYGVLSVEITPEEVDMVYLISIQMANALMAYHTEKKRLSVQRERELLLEELRSKNEILNFVSERDELTQIKNRRGFMEQAMKMNRIYKNRKAIILFADMDGLKQINDNYGHAAGDIAICACADILKKAAGVHGIAGRLGGDEFALMMIGDETRAIELMETVQKEIAMYNAQGKNKFAIDMSVGCQIVLCTEELSIPMVLEKADKIMYEEKKKKGKAR